MYNLKLNKKTRIFKKVNGGALYYAIFIAFLISVLSGLLLLYTYIHNSYINRQILQEQAFSNVRSGINLVLMNPELVGYESEDEIELFGNNYDKVKLRKEHWGVYDLIFAESNRQNYKASRIALVGDHLGKKDDVALYLADQKKYLSISGNTILKGTCYLPKLGIKRAYIEGQGYQNRELVFGKVLNSESKLPDLNSEKIKYLESLVTKTLSKQDSIVELKRVPNKLLYNSFFNKSLVLYSDQMTNLSGVRLEGNIILKFDQEIIIPENCYLKDIIIIAPSVNITDGFKGNIQVLATERINVGNSCQLKYPSFLGVVKSKEDKSFVMNIGTGSTIAGGVMLYSSTARTSNPLKMKLENSSKIYGTVYCDGYIEHKGNIYGSLYCNGFTLKTAASLYENHLLNAEVDYSKLPKDFIGVNLIGNPVNEKIIKWLE